MIPGNYQNGSDSFLQCVKILGYFYMFKGSVASISLTIVEIEAAHLKIYSSPVSNHFH